jgi:hypothetical protein
MAITDVRELRSFEYSETLGEKGKITLNGSVELLALHDATPDFGVLAEDTTAWANLGYATIPQVGELRLAAGVLFKVKSRKLSYYKGDDADRAVKIAIAYEAQKEDTEQPTPEEEEAEGWLRISVTSEQKECPLTDQGENGEYNAAPKAATNSAGDPVDGLTENRCLLRIKYTNTKVKNPGLGVLNGYLNTTNKTQFLGAKRRTMLCVGYSADYDDKQSLWTVSVEWLLDPKGHYVEFYDAGFNEIVGGERRAILDVRGNPVGKPVQLDGSGLAVLPSLLTGQNAKDYIFMRKAYPYEEKEHANIFSEARI